MNVASIRAQLIDDLLPLIEEARFEAAAVLWRQRMGALGKCAHSCPAGTTNVTPHHCALCLERKLRLEGSNAATSFEGETPYIASANRLLDHFFNYLDCA